MLMKGRVFLMTKKRSAKVFVAPSSSPSTTPSPYSSSHSKLYLSPNLSLSYDIISSISNYISQGLSLSDSFSLLGIPKSTYTRWFKIANTELKNREDGIYDSSNDIYLSLLFDTEQSLSHYQLTLLSKLNNSDDTKATTFLLERVFKDRFAVQTNVKSESNVTLGTGGKIEIVIKDETDKEKVDQLEKEILMNR